MSQYPLISPTVMQIKLLVVVVIIVVVAGCQVLDDLRQMIMKTRDGIWAIR